MNEFYVLLLMVYPLICVVMAFRAGNRDDYKSMAVWFFMFGVWFIIVAIIGEPNDCITYIDDMGIQHCIDKELITK